MENGLCDCATFTCCFTHSRQRILGTDWCVSAPAPQVARLSLGWDERLSLVLAEDLCLRRLKFADELMKENEDIPEADNAARLDADFALMSETVTRLQERILALFGGEAE